MNLSFETLVEWANLGNDKLKLPPADIVQSRYVNAMRVARDTNWGTAGDEALLVNALREYALAELRFANEELVAAAVSGYDEENKRLAKELQAVKMQLGKAKKQIERLKANGDELDQTTE